MSNNQWQDVAVRFNGCINDRDIEGLATLMTDDHTFIDSGDNVVQGKSDALQAWEGFFDSFPDYQNVFEKVATRNETVTIIGHSTCSDKRLHGPAIWTAKIIKSKVAEWRVYDDTPDIRQKLGV